MLIERFGSLPIYLLANKLLAHKTWVAAIVLMAVGILPAQAEELRDWQYDEQTRSLTLILPDSVVPLISVVSPDQLVLELPNTQVGDVMGQSIRDGLVESIVLEQATPETVWVVMDFAAGTVLADSQDATLLADVGGGDRQWQVRPALVAASRRAAGQSVASADLPNESAASVLRTPTPAIAQTSDFADLPVLEPAMPIDQPVSVPPLSVPALPDTDEASPSVVVPPLEAATASAPQVPPSPAREFERVEERSSEESLPVFDVEVIPAELPVASEVEPVIEPAIEPVEPPFLGDFESDSQSIPVQPLPNEPPVVVDPASDDSIVASGTDSIAPAVTEPVAAEPLTEAAQPEAIQPANVSRWPEPIPFGQPLPR